MLIIREQSTVPQYQPGDEKMLSIVVGPLIIYLAWRMWNSIGTFASFSGELGYVFLTLVVLIFGVSMTLSVAEESGIWQVLVGFLMVCGVWGEIPALSAWTALAHPWRDAARLLVFLGVGFILMATALVAMFMMLRNSGSDRRDYSGAR